jgi:hypothetical protein
VGQGQAEPARLACHCDLETLSAPKESIRFLDRAARRADDPTMTKIKAPVTVGYVSYCPKCKTEYHAEQPFSFCPVCGRELTPARAASDAE